MVKLINILAGCVLCLASASAAYAGAVKSPAMHESAAQAGKDTAAMDALVQSLQGGGMVKVGLSSASRSRTGDAPAGAQSFADGLNASSEEPAEVDTRMLIAGLALVGVIALRRIRS